MTESTSQLVLTEVTGDIATLRLNRPDKLNAINDELLEELHDALAELHEDPYPGLLVTGEGRATTAGRDVDVVSQPDFERADVGREMSRLLRTYPYPSAMAGKGAVIGMGFGMSLSCDFVVVGEETHLSYPEINYDIDTSGSLRRIAEFVGPRVAKEIAMTGEPIAPQRAYELGLVNDVVPEERVEDRARELLESVVEHDNDILRNFVEASRLADD